jgi:hypothetical protein
MQIEDVAAVDARHRPQQPQGRRYLARAREHAPGAERDRHLFAQELFDGLCIARMHLAARPNQRTVDIRDEELRQLAGLAGAAG